MYYTIIPTIFHALFDVTAIQKTEDRDVVLLREPKDAAYYEFSAKDDLVITNKYPGFTPDEVLKSFHADTYCFDSLPEKECFFQYIKSDKVQEVYFTEMFTSNQGDLSVYYYDPESGRIWQYYPDFLAKMKDGSILINNSRGQLIDEQDVADALKAGKLAAAGLDVVYTEPIQADNPLLTAPNCIITPHMSWGAKEARQRIMDITVENVKAYVNGAPINVVNK